LRNTGGVPMIEKIEEQKKRVEEKIEMLGRYL
jgi:hypothetical protein